MAEPVWIEEPEVIIAHARQLAEHGGSDGIRDIALLESALARPKNVHAYDGDADLCRLAASYAYGIARNHPFVDGNKRIALVVCEGFLRLNGMRIVAPREDKYTTHLRLADGSLTEPELADWLRRHAVITP